MMGTKARHFAPLINVSVEQLVPQDHFYRHVERTLDLSFVREFVQQTYAGIGRPSIDPIVFFKLQLVMFFEDIRSERLLMRHTADRLSVRWYVGYDLDEPLPDHSSLTRIRERYGVEVFRRFFEQIVEHCQAAGLVWGKELYIDATKVEANASLDSLTPRFAVEAHLANVFAEEAAAQTEQHMAQEEATASEPGEQAEEEVPMQLPVALSQEDREALCQHNEERYDWLEHLGAQDRSVSIPWYQRVADVQVSTTDPDASLMLTKNGSHLGYQTHYVVDGGNSRIILGVLVAPSEVSENKPMLDLLWRARFRWKLWPRQATGDRKYGTEENLVAIESQHLHAYIPSPDNDHRTAFFSSQEFQYNAERDVHICPAGKELHYFAPHSTERSRRYRARAKDCNHCPLKAQCTPGKQGRSLCRSVDEDTLDRVRAYASTETYKKALRKRSVWVEPLFAEGKQWHGMRRFRLRLLWRVNCEAHMIAAGQNLKRLLSKRGWGRRPYPTEALCAFFLAAFGWLTRPFLEKWSFSLPIGSAYSMARTQCVPFC
ncbi:MAG TPA: IS1182 family transposase [Ktedonobacteraceae bacterium]|nr:IS1182 family transposase [Ktedonobacteraceae bacterium]